MAKLSPIEKEIQFLYNKHNKNTNYPLEVEPIEFPQYIIKILEKQVKRTDLETKKINKYRERVLYALRQRSSHLEFLALEEKEEKRKESQKKNAKKKDIKYANYPNKVKHFGVWFDNNPAAKLNRDSYAQIDKKSHHKVPPFMMKHYAFHPEERSQKYDNDQCTIYTDSWCEKHRERCLKNFDLNITFCAQLDKSKFEKSLSNLIKKRKNFKEIYDINDCDEVQGIYVLVLDEYKQFYIGQSINIKRRILEHWRKKKEFDKLIYNNVETSILSIDVFGPLDTTRIFILETNSSWDLDDTEKLLVASANSNYLLNRTGGGIHGDTLSVNLEVNAKRKSRNLVK